jgi:hypothetical protein
MNEGLDFHGWCPTCRGEGFEVLHQRTARFDEFGMTHDLGWKPVPIICRTCNGRKRVEAPPVATPEVQ